MKSLRDTRAMFRSARKRYKAATNIITMMLAGNMRRSAARLMGRGR